MTRKDRIQEFKKDIKDLRRVILIFKWLYVINIIVGIIGGFLTIGSIGTMDYEVEAQIYPVDDTRYLIMTAIGLLIAAVSVKLGQLYRRGFKNSTRELKATLKDYKEYRNSRIVFYTLK